MKNRHGFTLVEIMIVVAIIALLAAIAIPNLLRAKITANEAAAQAALKTIATSCETFATANNGTYPTAEASMLAPNATPPYYNRTYDGTIVQGYRFTFTGATTGYTVVATPGSVQTGTRTFTITTGAILQ